MDEHTIKTASYRAAPLRAFLVKQGATFREVSVWWFGRDFVIESPSAELMAALAEYFAELESEETW